MSYFDPGTGDHVMVDGNIVERDALNIAERLAEYDENLVIMCLDPALAGINDAPFIICEAKDGRLLRVMEAWALDERILERIYNSDTRRHDIIAAIEGKEIQMRKDAESRYKEKSEESKEIMVAAIKNPSSSFSLVNSSGDLVRIHENAPKTINKGKRSF